MRLIAEKAFSSLRLNRGVDNRAKSAPEML